MVRRRVLVTGGAGFIGSHLVEALLREGSEVVVLDNESTGRREHVHPGARFVHGDVRDPSALSQVFGLGLDAVCHIAGQASIRVSYADPSEDLAVNVTGTVNVITHCLRHRVPRLVYASSMTVYGNPAQVPTPEAEAPDPVSYYGITKYAAERYVHLTGRRTDLDAPFDVTSLRMFNVFGPRQSLTNPYQGVLAIFIGNLLRGEPICIHSDGEQSRDFVHVTDVVRAWVEAIDRPETFGRVFNVGSGSPTSVNLLCDTVLAQFGESRASFSVSTAAEQQGDIRESAADISAIKAAIDWTPEVGLSEGMAETVRWARGAG